jgi:hypothetical protein
MNPIQTKAYGRRFRSRTEARWAVAFTEYQIKWEYELEGFELRSGKYLPDFFLPQVDMWAEVKGDRFILDELHKAHDLANATDKPVLLLIGQPQDLSYFAIEPDHSNHNYEKKLEDGTVVRVMDYSPFDSCEYHLDEGRFYAHSGGRGIFPCPFDYPCNREQPFAITAALSARFEHGEQLAYR